VLLEPECPATRVRRAVGLARLLDAPVHVLRVLPERTWLEVLFSPRTVTRAARAVQRTLLAREATLDRLRDETEGEGVIEHVAVARGELVEQVAVYAASVDAKWIIVPPGEAPLGKAITSLATASGMPVFVARESSGAAEIVAGTDLESQEYPVLAKAAEVGRQLRAPFVAVHNVPPQPLTGPELVWTTHLPRPQEVLDARNLLLTQAVERFSSQMKGVVREELNSSDAILREAQARDADLVVVGTRRRSWFDGLGHVSVATQVVDRSAHSVLVLPLDVAVPIRAVLDCE
jgi:nucleotide-binding universal stress UspA family protein